MKASPIFALLLGGSVLAAPASPFGNGFENIKFELRGADRMAGKIFDSLGDDGAKSRDGQSSRHRSGSVEARGEVNNTRSRSRSCIDEAHRREAEAIKVRVKQMERQVQKLEKRGLARFDITEARPDVVAHIIRRDSIQNCNRHLRYELAREMKESQSFAKSKFSTPYANLRQFLSVGNKHMIFVPHAIEFYPQQPFNEVSGCYLITEIFAQKGKNVQEVEDAEKEQEVEDGEKEQEVEDGEKKQEVEDGAQQKARVLDRLGMWFAVPEEKQGTKRPLVDASLNCYIVQTLHALLGQPIKFRTLLYTDHGCSPIVDILELKFLKVQDARGPKFFVTSKLDERIEKSIPVRVGFSQETPVAQGKPMPPGIPV